MVMKKGDLVRWKSSPFRHIGVSNVEDMVGTIIDGPTMFGFIERIYVLWNKYPKSIVIHHGEGLMRWVDCMDVEIISESR